MRGISESMYKETTRKNKKMKMKIMNIVKR
jgi:hypothetical protein